MSGILLLQTVYPLSSKSLNSLAPNSVSSKSLNSLAPNSVSSKSLNSLAPNSVSSKLLNTSQNNLIQHFRNQIKQAAMRTGVMHPQYTLPVAYTDTSKATATGCQIQCTYVWPDSQDVPTRLPCLDMSEKYKQMCHTSSTVGPFAF